MLAFFYFLFYSRRLRGRGFADRVRSFAQAQFRQLVCARYCVRNSQQTSKKPSAARRRQDPLHVVICPKSGSSISYGAPQLQLIVPSEPTSDDEPIAWQCRVSRLRHLPTSPWTYPDHQAQRSCSSSLGLHDVYAFSNLAPSLQHHRSVRRCRVSKRTGVIVFHAVWRIRHGLSSEGAAR